MMICQTSGAERALTGESAGADIALMIPAICGNRSHDDVTCIEVDEYVSACPHAHTSTRARAHAVFWTYAAAAES